MPGLNFNYTKFLREQHEKYIQKYGEDKITKVDNPQPINGYGGFTPAYRGSISDQKVVRSLVRSLTSPMKPTTANGYRAKSKQFFRPEDTPREPAKDESLSTPKVKGASKTPTVRAKSAPVVSDRIIRTDEQTGDFDQRPYVSRISVMSAGGSNYVENMDRRRRPTTSQASVRSSINITPQPPNRPESRSPSARSIKTPLSNSTQQVTRPKHPQGYPETLYGISFWYDWGDSKNSLPDLRKRPTSYDHDQHLTRRDGVIYHKHEGMVPKYMGYVPNYKFRHGSTFGVLTVNAAGVYPSHVKLAKV